MSGEFSSRKESSAAQQERFREGRIRDEEVRAHWDDPINPLFEHELPGRNGKEGIRFRVRALT